jgi:hypothetical protein
LWLFWTAPIIGGLLAAGVYSSLSRTSEADQEHLAAA